MTGRSIPPKRCDAFYFRVKHSGDINGLLLARPSVARTTPRFILQDKGRSQALDWLSSRSVLQIRACVKPIGRFPDHLNQYTFPF